jgi:hypothetical protein
MFRLTVRYKYKLKKDFTSMSGRLGYTSSFIKRQRDGPPIDQLRIDNWPEAEGNNSQYTHGVRSRLTIPPVSPSLIVFLSITGCGTPYGS